jgi:hypothetical protein
MGTPPVLRACACLMYGTLSPGSRPQLFGLGNAMGARRWHVNSSINHAMGRHTFAVVEIPILRRTPSLPVDAARRFHESRRPRLFDPCQAAHDRWPSKYVRRTSTSACTRHVRSSCRLVNPQLYFCERCVSSVEESVSRYSSFTSKFCDMHINSSL